MLTFGPLRHAQCLLQRYTALLFHCLLQVHSLYTKEVFTFKYGKPILVGSLSLWCCSASAEVPRLRHQLHLHLHGSLAVERCCSLAALSLPMVVPATCRCCCRALLLILGMAPGRHGSSLQEGGQATCCSTPGWVALSRQMFGAHCLDDA